MKKVYIVYKEIGYTGDEDKLLCVHATAEGAAEECRKMFEIKGRYPNPFYWQEEEVQP